MYIEDLKIEFRFDCESRRLSPKTIANYLKQIDYLIAYLAAQFGIAKVEEVTAHHIRRFLMMKQEQGRKPAYLNDLLKAYKVLFRYAKREEYIKESPADKVKNVKQPKVIIRTFDNGEIKRMVDCYSGHSFQEIRNRAIIVMFFETGVRLSELTGLREADIHDNYILIHGKGEKERVVPKSPLLGKALIKYLRVRNNYFDGRKNLEAVFVSRYGKLLSNSFVDKIVREAGAYAKVREDIRTSPHTIRHCFAQQQLLNGLDIYSLARLMGHENIAITQRYLEGLRDKEILNSARRTSTLMNL